jgi:hypothetical protein
MLGNRRLEELMRYFEPIGYNQNPPVLPDMGLPAIAFFAPAMLVLLIPIVLVEAFVMWRRLSLPIGRAMSTSLVANVVSTIVGIPVVGLLSMLSFLLIGILPVEIRTSPLGAVIGIVIAAPWFSDPQAWILPNPDWKLFASIVVLFIEFFLASWWLELQVVRRMLQTVVDPRLVVRAVRDANLASYGIIAAVWACGYLFVPQVWSRW